MGYHRGTKSVNSCSQWWRRDNEGQFRGRLRDLQCTGMLWVCVMHFQNYEYIENTGQPSEHPDWHSDNTRLFGWPASVRERTSRNFQSDGCVCNTEETCRRRLAIRLHLHSYRWPKSCTISSVVKHWHKSRNKSIIPHCFENRS